MREGKPHRMNRKLSNILVTGGAGFVGVNFIRYLFEKTDFSGRIVNFDVQTYADNPASGNGQE
jgi:dTDP-glucose 4,6-dehydratase